MRGPCDHPECGGAVHPEAVRCPNAPKPDDFFLEECPHCEAPVSRNRVDQHVAEAHADLPPCTARIEPEQGGLYTCAFRAGHTGGEYGSWHASKRGAGMGRYVWNDSAIGAVPHREPEPPFNTTCAVLHTDGQGNAIPCPGHPHADEGRPEPPSDEELNTALPVRDPRQPAYDAVYEYIRGLGNYLPSDPAHRNAAIWRAVHAALDATPVGRCVSSHCVEGDHILGETP